MSLCANLTLFGSLPRPFGLGPRSFRADCRFTPRNIEPNCHNIDRPPVAYLSTNRNHETSPAGFHAEGTRQNKLSRTIGGAWPQQLIAKRGGKGGGAEGTPRPEEAQHGFPFPNRIKCTAKRCTVVCKMEEQLPVKSEDGFSGREKDAKKSWFSATTGIKIFSSATS